MRERRKTEKKEWKLTVGYKNIGAVLYNQRYCMHLIVCVCVRARAGAHIMFAGGRSPAYALQGYMLLGKVYWLSWRQIHNAARPIGPDENK